MAKYLVDYWKGRWAGIGFEHISNEFCSRCRGKEIEETVLHILGSCPAPCQRSNWDVRRSTGVVKHLYCSLSLFIRLFEWFRNWGIGLFFGGKIWSEIVTVMLLLS